MTPSQPDPRVVLTEALVNASKRMGLDETRVAALIGLDPEMTKQMFNGMFLLNDKGRQYERALQLIKLYRALLAVAGDDEGLRHWLKTENQHFNERPIDFIMTKSGLNNTIGYLDIIKSK